ncbi:MAG: ABC transporter ATP-binding protein [Lachnospiraceae bacterium]|nr:ABC transporter ATP-binding protein [Lachnospiraceae bacterium]
MSVAITVDHALKKYGDNIVIPDLSLKIHEGEFFTLLGPSGCGKTTLLRMIAGFNSIEGGEFYFNDKKINDLDPGKRNIGMVFQNYAIFPHLSVRDNVAFGLTNRKVPKEEIKRRTDKFMEIVQITQYADRMPERLSGGQQQRVALARALVIEPDVLLMDEPLSNLDAKLRLEMRAAIKEIQHEVGITTVYVTHDQEEAMAVSDRIAVMSGGVIQHIGRPKDIYQRPANRFVANFIGQSNFLTADLKEKNGSCSLVFASGYMVPMDHVRTENRKSQEVVVSIRPEDLKVTLKEEPGLNAVVNDSVFLGMNTHYFVTLDSGEKMEIIQESTIDSIIAPGTRIRLTVNEKKINIFTKDGSRNLLEDSVAADER